MNILKVNRPSDYSSFLGVADRHPLVCVIDYDRISPVHTSLNDYGVYGIFLRGDNLVDLTYLQAGGRDVAGRLHQVPETVTMKTGTDIRKDGRCMKKECSKFAA